MPPSGPPLRPAWFDPLVAEVDRAFEVTGADTPGWPDPHPDRDPPQDQYSRCLDPAKYRILDARVDAWAQALAPRSVSMHDVPAEPWLDSPVRQEGHLRVRRLSPAAPDGLALLLANTVVGGEPFGLEIGIAQVGMPTAYVDLVPDCGCNACDSGSADLLATLDGWILTVARGGVVHARSAHARSTQTVDGWQGSGAAARAWLSADSPVPAGVQRWVGTAWL